LTKLRIVISWQRLNLSALNASAPAEFQRGCRVDGNIAEGQKLRTVISWQTLNLSTLNASTPAEFQRGCRVDGDIAEIVTRSVRIFLVSAHTAPPAAQVRAVC